MQHKKKKVLFLIILIGIGLIALPIAHFILFSKLESVVRQKIQALNETGYSIQYDSIHSNWLANIIYLDALVLEKDAPDTACVHPEFVKAGKIQVEGFSLLSYLINKKLSFDRIRLIEPHIALRENSRLLPGSASEKKTGIQLSIDALSFEAARLEFADTSCNVITELSTDININGLSVQSHPDRPLDIKFSTILLDNSRLSLPEAFYTFLFRQIRCDWRAGTAVIDTVKVLPHHTKLAFGKKAGHERDRVEGVIPYMKFSGIKFEHRDTFLVNTTNADIQMYLKIFRDKRLPDNEKFTLLPVQQLQKLSFGLNIDTIKVIKSYISYEEFAEEAETSGTVFFDNLYATIYNVSNNMAVADGRTILDAQADFMGDGRLQIHSVLPWKIESDNLMEGSLKNFSLSEINTMLVPVANMKIESGTLKSLDFKYTYNMIRSTGEIELNYEKLKIISFKDEEKTKQKKNGGNGKLEKDNFKSFILNAFIVKKNMNEDVPEEKRTGAILFERNTARSVFNYWWKSVFTGIKSAYNLDKIQERIVKKNIRKERRKTDKKSRNK